MGLLQKAVETYDANAKLIGVYQAGRDPLAPIGHSLTNADVEITLNAQGAFLSARKVEKTEPKILFPVTEDSSGRTSGLAPHPLCDQLKYIACTNEKAHTLYLQTLRAWMESPHSHPFLLAVFSYAEDGSILNDLAGAGLLEDAEQYALGYTGRSVLPAALEGAVLELAILRYRRRGMEGETVHGEGGLQTTMEGLSSALEKLLNRYRRAKVV